MEKLLKKTLFGILHEIHELKSYILIVLIFLVLSYSTYLVFDEKTLHNLTYEEGLFENLTAICFFIAAIFFFRTYLLSRNLFFLFLCVIFLLGAGEELSWGQRIFNLKTPDFLNKINVQGEINFHNISLVNAKSKHGVAKLLTIEFQYKLFWLFYCVIIPFGVFFWEPLSLLTQKIRLPVPPITLGIFFLINWVIFRITLSFLLPPNMSGQYYWGINELMECVTAFLFMMLSIYFFNSIIGRSHVCPTSKDPEL